MKKYLIKFSTIAILIILVAMLIEAFILRMVDKKNAYRISELLLNQIVDVINTNQRDGNDLYASVKEDYIYRAQSVAYILDTKPEIENDIAELEKIARLLSIDEINIFDKDGVIYAGNVPHYFGLSFDSGDQIGYFKPMLNDKSYTMCQDVTPNTSEEKQMMYAITWNSLGTKMIQVGIEPFRLLEVMKRNEISRLLSEIPVTNGVEIYVANVDTGKIIASNPANVSVTCLEDIGIERRDDILRTYTTEIFKKDGFKNYYSFTRRDNNIICISYSVNANLNTFIITMHLFCVYLSIAAFFIILISMGRMKDNSEKLNQFRILSNMSRIYYSMHLIDFSTNSAVEYTTRMGGAKLGTKYNEAQQMVQNFIKETASPVFLQAMLNFVDGNTIIERMKGKKIITEDFLSQSGNWFRASFISILSDKSDNVIKAIFTIQNVDEEKNREAVLVQKSTTDELTGTFNRRAYEEDLKDLQINDDFEYIEFDINELKNANDTIGHEAGDEMIKTASKYMNEYFGEFGRIYRTGGDEFVGILKADKTALEKAKSKFDEKINSWSGKLVNRLSVSYGCVSSKEQNWNNLLEITKEADKRMYQSKAAYYQKSGIDRRAHQRAYFAASSLYTKILKVNLTNDSFKIVNLDKDEQTIEKGFSESFSKWNQQFAELGLISEYDKDYYLKKVDLNYLSKYFKSGKKMLAISYKRKINGDFKQVMMEIIPADDYEDENQNCYLYVKSIEV